jgi:hypothetical protein
MTQTIIPCHVSPERDRLVVSELAKGAHVAVETGTAHEWVMLTQDGAATLIAALKAIFPDLAKPPPAPVPEPVPTPEPAPFKPGDRVRLTDDDGIGHPCVKAGDVLTVQRVYRGQLDPNWHITVTDPHIQGWGFRARRFVLAPPFKPAMWLGAEAFEKEASDAP